MEYKDKKCEALEKDEITAIIGQRIKKVRENKKYTQEELAEKSSIDRAYIGHIEQGRKCISIFTAKKIAEALEISLSDLFKDL